MSSTRLKSGRVAIGVTAMTAMLVILAWRVFANAPDAGAPAGPPPAPVAIAHAETRDVPHLTSGIGSVQSLHGVLLRPQVSGVVTDVMFQEGQHVERGVLLVRIDDRAIAANLAAARAEKARNEAQLKAARLDLVRYANLLDEEAISRQTVEQQAAQVEQLEAAIRANEATIAAQEVQLSYTRITAPVSGRVGIRRVDPGNLVQAGDEGGLVSVTQIDPISVVFTLPQELLPRIAALQAQRADVRVSAFDRDAGTLLAQGRLTMVDNQIDPATGTIRLRAAFSNRDHRLWPGQFVAVRLQTGVSRSATVVPARTVQQGLQGAFLYRVRDGRAEVVRVEVDYTDDEIAVIRSGLAHNDAVVIDGHSRLKPGAEVSVVADASAAAVARAEGTT